MNDFLLAKVAVIWADTPKSAVRKGRKGIVKRDERNRGEGVKWFIKDEE